jgi:hypothetical protein
MKKLLAVLAIFFCCGVKVNYCEATSSDTTIVSRSITNEIPGSALRKRAKQYYFITGKDTSSLQFYMIESNDGNVDIDIADHRISHENISYRELLTELKAILPMASKDFNFKVLHSIFLGRLVQKGDIAVQISNQYSHEIGSASKKIDYTKTVKFLIHSKLSSDLNIAFKIYNLSVHDVSIEHPFFTTKNELYYQNIIETPSNEVPKKIFDCMAWVELRPID